MEVALTPELEQLIDEQVTNGSYPSAGEVIRDALRLFKGHVEHRGEDLEALRRDVQVGIDALEDGEFTEYDLDDIQQLAEEIKARGRDQPLGRGNRATA